MSEISLKFVLETDSGKKENFILKNIKENVSDEEINVYANKIIQNQYLVPSDGSKFLNIERVVKVTITEERVM